MSACIIRKRFVLRLLRRKRAVNMSGIESGVQFGSGHACRRIAAWMGLVEEMLDEDGTFCGIMANMYR